MNWTALKDGKYIEKTLSQIIFSDPNWFFWTVEKDILEMLSLPLYSMVFQ
jgi:hypothetical protein